MQPLLKLPYHQTEPMVLHLRRGGGIESSHEVDIALVDKDGAVIVGCGAVERDIFPRSAIKPLQAIALLELLDDDVALSADDIALICASHNAEAFHTEQVQALLVKFGFSSADLICGSHWSLDQATLIAQARTLDRPNKLHNNCSGKHAGMLALASVLGASPKNYGAIGHPVQQRILGVLEALSGADLLTHSCGIDGCGAPALSGNLGNWARAFAVFADPDELPQKRQQAIARIRGSIAASPLFIAGNGRGCSAIAGVYGERITAKVGAEGVYGAAFNDLGLGLMLKTRDGNRRGAEMALGVIIRGLGYETPPELDGFFNPILRNWAGEPVGDVMLGGTLASIFNTNIFRKIS